MKLLRLPGLIDIHVHFRDPGETHKEDFYTGTRAALAGGVTTVFDMPNNKEPVFSEKVLDEKIKIAQSKAVCDWSLYFGSIGDDTAEFEKVAHKVIALKVFLNMTTGKYIVEDEEKIENIVKYWPKNKPIVFHAEGDKVDLVIKLTEKYKNKTHVTHLNDKISLEKIIQAKKDKLPVTCDVAPHYLFLTKDDENKLKGLSKVKPPLATIKDQNFLWQNLKWIDCIASDHAPHTKNEKLSDTPPAGMPGLETMLPLMLKAVNEDRIQIEEIVRLMKRNPEKIFNLKYDGNSNIELDMDGEYLIENKNLYTKSGWSAFEGTRIKGRIIKVILRNKLVFNADKILISPGFGLQKLSTR